jgi:phosphoenolpyruvate phosphomutase
MNTLGELLQSAATAMVCGVYDGLSAKLAEAAGFDAIWASGLCICSSRGIPDRSILAASELQERVSEITRATKLPIIVDGDEGYGDAESACKLVKALWQLGAQGVSIEDSRHPKANSFMVNCDRGLLTISEYREKLQRVKAAAPEMIFIARTEALICGEDLEQALNRATAYGEAGADAVIIHSRARELAEFAAMASRWNRNVPLVVIPSLADRVSFQELAVAGYRAVIYANQLMRAAVYSASRLIQVLRDCGEPWRIAERLVSMEELFVLGEINRNSLPLPAGALHSTSEAAIEWASCWSPYDSADKMLTKHARYRQV